jgi:hypothetical protein
MPIKGTLLLKGRFPWLRSIRLVITEDFKSLKRNLQIIDATIILHNMLIEFGEEEPEDWIEFDDISDMDEAACAPYDEDDELNEAVPEWAPKGTRRNQILQYFKEIFFSKLVYFFVNLRSILNVLLLAVEDINNPFHLRKDACNPII